MPAKKPRTLDIVRLDERWVQLYSSDVGVYLDNNTRVKIDWKQYRLTNHLDMSVANLRETKNVEFSAEEIENIKWGSEEKSYPYLKMEVKVFGIYKIR